MLKFASIQDARAAMEAKGAEIDALFGRHENTMESLPMEEAKGLLAEANQIHKALRQLEEAEGLRKSARLITDDLPKSNLVLPNGQPASSAAKGTLGEQFVSNTEFKSWMNSIAPSGVISENRKGIVSPVVETKTLVTGLSDTSAGALVQPHRFVDVIPALRRPLVLRDIVTRIPTSSDSYEQVKIDVETNNAAPVAEATATGGSSGTKPESGFTFAKVSGAISTIAHWIPVTKRALSDAPQLRALIDEFLQEGLDQELEDQMATGDGTGENFTGIANAAGTQSQAWDTNLFTTLRRAKTKVRVVGRDTATAYLLHPNDAERIDLELDANDNYYGGGPFGQNQPTVWRLPIVESEAIAEGTGYVGNFRQLVLLDREATTVQATDSHADFFIRNMVAVLAEFRAGFYLRRPKSIVEIDLTA